jgi:hypothetical protein
VCMHAYMFVNIYVRMHVWCHEKHSLNGNNI